MLLTTPVHIAPPPFRLSHSDRLLLLGSCFTTAISDRLSQAGFSVVSNPFGELYNPASIASCLLRLLDERPFTPADLVPYDGLWHSMLHHGSFSSSSQEETLRLVNESLTLGHQALLNADVLILTFGTAFVYERQGTVVANCHKMPAASFSRRLLSVNEIVSSWQSLLALPALRTKRLIFTVSPIRHLRDGLHANQLSKSILLLSTDALCSSPSPSSSPYSPSPSSSSPSSPFSSPFLSSPSSIPSSPQQGKGSGLGSSPSPSSSPYSPSPSSPSSLSLFSISRRNLP